MLTDAVKVLFEAVSAFRGLAPSTFSGGESAYEVRESAWGGGHDSAWLGLWRTHACLQTL